jgi:hypothetical protein
MITIGGFTMPLQAQDQRKSAATDAGILSIFVLFGKALKLKGLVAAVKLMLCDHEVMSSLLQKQKCR